MMDLMRAFVKSKWALLLFVPLIIAFGIFGFNDPFSGVSGGGFVRAGERSIGARDVTRELDNYIEDVRRDSGEIISQREAAERGAAAGLVQQLTIRTVALAYADRIGLRASPVAVAEMIDAQPVFQDGLGKVDRAAIARYANDQGFSVAEFEDDSRQRITLNYLLQAISAGLTAPEILTRPVVSFLGEKRTVRFARLTTASVPPVPTPTEEQLRAFHAERAALFAQPERRILSVISYSAADFIDKAEIGDDQVKSEYDRRIREFSTPETREIGQFSSTDRNAIQTVVDTVKQGKTLEEAVNATPGVTLATLSVKPGDLTDKTMGDAAFGMPVGETFGPMEVGQLFYGVQVQSVTPGTPTPLAEVAAQIRAEMGLREGGRKFDESAEDFADLVSGGSSLEEISDTIGAPVIQLAPVDARGGFEGGGGSSLLARHAAAVGVMFQLKVGETGDIVEADGERAILRLDEIIPARTPPFEEVRDQLDEIYIAAKQVEAAEKVATDMVAAVKAGASFDNAAKAAKMGVISPPGPLMRASPGSVDPAVLEAVFAQTAGVAAVARDRQGEPWVIIVDAVEPVSAEDGAQLSAQVSQQMLQSLDQDLGDAFQRGIQTEIKPKTNQAAIAAYLASFTTETTAP